MRDVVWSNAGQPKPGADEKLPPVGNTASAMWTNTIGEPEIDHRVARPGVQSRRAGLLRGHSRCFERRSHKCIGNVDAIGFATTSKEDADGARKK